MLILETRFVPTSANAGYMYWYAQQGTIGYSIAEELATAFAMVSVNMNCVQCHLIVVFARVFVRGVCYRVPS